MSDPLDYFVEWLVRTTGMSARTRFNLFFHAGLLVIVLGSLWGYWIAGHGMPRLGPGLLAMGVIICGFIIMIYCNPSTLARK